MSGASPPEPAFEDEKARGGRGRWKGALLPVLVTAGSLAGVAAVMAGLLAYLSPTQDTTSGTGAEPTPMIAQMAPADSAGGTSAPGTDPANAGGAATAAEAGAAASTAEAGASGAGASGVGTATVGPGGVNAPLVEAAPAASPPAPVAVSVKPLRKSVPTRVRIPGIGVDAALTSVGVAKNGEIEVPPLSRPKLAGWYRLGPAPGEMGPAVILGHVNTRSGPAVFSRLRELRRGDAITVVRADGSAARFTVDGAEQASKNRFPTKRVYGHVDRPSLRLITCGGVFNSRTRSYTDNIIVYATLSGSGSR
ncbi:class F sortase [Sphaerisporangium dianthi]|uniref:Class F sortase n=1 Tax=Sphaerisporangium dianthi TaxID=1436120 RepID=A0ABV9CB09_9ACTN